MRSAALPPSIAALLFAALAIPAQCQEPAPSARTDPRSPRATLLATIRPRNIYQTLEGTISPDGRRYLYEKEEHGQRRLWLLDLESGRAQLLTPRDGDRRNPVWSGDGRQIAFTGDVKVPGYAEGLSGVWVMDLADAQERLVYTSTRYTFTWTASWTPDGRVVFSDWAGGQDQPSRIMAVDPRTGGAATIGEERMTLEGPSVSPDGAWLAFVGAPCRDTLRNGLYVMRLPPAPSRRRRCLVDVPSGEMPVWSPDGRTLYRLERPGNGAPPQVAAVSVTSGVRTLVDLRGVPGEASRISVSRDGALVLAVHSGFFRVGTVPAAGGVPVALQRDTTLDTAFPIWALDGSTVAAVATAPRQVTIRERQLLATIGATGARLAHGALTAVDAARDSSATMAYSPDARCVVDERSLASRDSFADMRASAPPPLVFTEAALSHAGAATPNFDLIFAGGTQWDARGTRVLKQAWRKLYVIDRTEGPSPAGCRSAGPPRVVPLGNFRGQPLGWRLSPDGRSIALGRLASDTTQAGVFVVPTTGGAVQLLRALPLDDSFGGPEWSRDGRALYYADADSAGLYRILRLTLATGVVDTITHGPLSAVHPRLSPDGRTLAVTLVNAPTTLWRVAPPEDAPARAAPIGNTTAARTPVGSAPRRGSAPDPRLVDLASRIAGGHDALERVWPGYWGAAQAYLLEAPTIPGALLVASDAPIAGFREISLPTPPAAPLRAYWYAGPLKNANGLSVPRVTIASFPRPDADTLAHARWRERVLFDLFLGDTAMLGAYEVERAWGAGLPNMKERPVRFELCVTGLPSSCGAMRRLERRVLSAALHAPAATLEDAVRRYVAVRWIRRATRGDGDIDADRANGARLYAAHRAAIALAGTDPVRYAIDVISAFDALPAADTGAWEIQEHRTVVTGQALAVLLDRLGRAWKADLYKGDDFLVLAARAVRFDSLAALRLANQEYRRYALPTLIRQSVAPSDSTRDARGFADYHRNYYYYLVARALVRDSMPLTFNLPNARSGGLDTSRFRLRFSPGAGDSASAPDGMLFLPDPESFVIESADFRASVQHVPVLVNTRPQYSGYTAVQIFLPDRVMRRIRMQNSTQRPLPGAPVEPPAPPEGQHVAGPGYDLWFGPRTPVQRTNVSQYLSVDVWPARPPRP